jgi:hypothetical protein
MLTGDRIVANNAVTLRGNSSGPLRTNECSLVAAASLDVSSWRDSPSELRILQETVDNQSRYRIRLDPSYADYRWQTLAAIVRELSGSVHPSPPGRN